MYYAPSGRSIDRRRQAINNRHTRFRTRHSHNHRNREPLSDWTVDKDVRSSHGSVETIGERVKLKKSNGRQKDNHHAEDTKRADWTPANNRCNVQFGREQQKSQRKRRITGKYNRRWR
eukprot:scaffold92370_cov58-Attheya_sp.AAC.1